MFKPIYNTGAATGNLATELPGVLELETQSLVLFHTICPGREEASKSWSWFHPEGSWPY